MITNAIPDAKISDCLNYVVSNTDNLVIINANDVSKMLLSNSSNDEKAINWGMDIGIVMPPFKQFGICCSNPYGVKKLCGGISSNSKKHSQILCSIVSYYDRGDIEFHTFDLSERDQDYQSNIKYIMKIDVLTRIVVGIKDTGVVHVRFCFVVLNDGRLAMKHTNNGNKDQYVVSAGQEFVDIYKPGMLTKEQRKHFESVSDNLINEMSNELFLTLTCISFMNCHNIEIVEREPTKKQAKVKKEKEVVLDKKPFYKEYVLDITDIKRVLETTGNMKADGYKKAFHKCRGHFADYTQGSGLFGKIKGVFWIQEHTRGDKNVGEIKKDYNLKPKPS